MSLLHKVTSFVKNLDVDFKVTNEKDGNLVVTKKGSNLIVDYKDLSDDETKVDLRLEHKKTMEER